LQASSGPLAQRCQQVGGVSPPDRGEFTRAPACSEETQRAIVVARAGIAHDDAAKIVDLLQGCRQVAGFHRAISLRPAITIGKILGQNGVQADKHNSLFVEICVDSLISARYNGEDRKQMTEAVISLIKRHF